VNRDQKLLILPPGISCCRKLRVESRFTLNPEH